MIYKVEQKDKQLILSRVFQASKELAFQAYSSCEHLKHWWGPKAWPMNDSWDRLEAYFNKKL